MKQTMRHLALGLALFLASFASLGLAQSTPQQVKGINSQGAKWQALTDRGQVAVATNATTEYVAWKSRTRGPRPWLFQVRKKFQFGRTT